MTNLKIHGNKIVGGALGNCVHVSGIYEFLRIAGNLSYDTVFLGSAVDVRNFCEAIKKHDPFLVCVSYRLTPTGLGGLLDTFFDTLVKEDLLNRLFYFGGTPKCVEVAKTYPYFTDFFEGEEFQDRIIQSLTFNEGEEPQDSKPIIVKSSSKHISFPEKEKNENVLPMIRHHFGLPTLSETVKGIEKIANAEIVDVISIATDQNAQQYFFDPQKMDRSLDGTGGVPVRTEEDMQALFAASQQGNYPKLRVYSGTQDLMKWAKMSVDTINNAWGTIPLFWYSELDGRSKRPLKDAIKENQEVIKWYASQDIPVEINDSHHWSLRDSSDVTAVVDFYLSAYNAKKLGVKKYIAQLMMNTPRLTTAKMDLAKMLAKLELIDELKDENFEYWKQIRAGLTHFSVDMDMAKGQLATSTVLALALKPQILHVVSYSEANHAATPENVIESCKIVRGVMKNAWRGFPDLLSDKDIITRKNYLLKEAKQLIGFFIETFKNDFEDPLSNSACLGKIVNMGFMDAPQLKNNPAALGRVKTLPVNGGYDLVDDNGNVISHAEYVSKLISENKKSRLK